MSLVGDHGKWTYSISRLRQTKRILPEGPAALFFNQQQNNNNNNNNNSEATATVNDRQNLNIMFASVRFFNYVITYMLYITAS